jgi:choline dehydrogenase
MGTVKDNLAFVNPQLGVYGERRLRVVDASIMPYLVSGNSYSPTIMIGEKAPDMIISADY